MTKLTTYMAFSVMAFTFFLVPAVAKADMPIAILDMAKVIETSVAGKSVSDQLKKKREALQAEAKEFEKSLREKEEILIKQKKELEAKDFEAKKVAFEKEVMETRQTVLTKNSQIEKMKISALKILQEKVAKATADVADEKKIQVVLSRDAVVIAQQGLDITAEVLKRLDAEVKSVPLKAD